MVSHGVLGEHDAAIQFMLRVLAGKIEGVPRLSWCNFVFFHRIEAGRINKIRRYEPGDGYPGLWIVERDITFYLLKTPVATLRWRG